MRATPHFAWIPGSGVRGERQAAYQILVASSRKNLIRNIGDMWDSGPIQSGSHFGVAYSLPGQVSFSTLVAATGPSAWLPDPFPLARPARPLASNAPYYWKVRVWNGEGEVSEYSPPAVFETAMLGPLDWTAKWISFNNAETLPMFRKAFQVDKAETRARAYNSGMGFHELCLNGQKVGGDVLEPGWTNYRKSCQYVTYDVTAMLAQGDNALGVLFGNGMYNVIKKEGGRSSKFGRTFGPNKLILELQIEYADGTTAKTLSGGTWKVSCSPIIFLQIYSGKVYDARLELPGWDRTGFDDAAWSAATEVDGDGRVSRGDIPATGPYWIRLSCRKGVWGWKIILKKVR